MAKTNGPAAFRMIDAKDFSPRVDLFSFMDKPTPTASGGLAIGYRYDGAKLRIRTPKLRCPFGLQQGMNNSGYNIQLTFDDKTDAGKAFMAACKEFDRSILEAGVKNSDAWLGQSKTGKSLTRDVIEEKYSAMVKYRRNKETKAVDLTSPPSFKVKLPSETKLVDDPTHPDAKDGKVALEMFKCVAYDKNKQEIPIDDQSIQPGCYCSVIMTASSIWSTQQGFGATWKLEQVMVYPNENALPKMCLLDIDNDDDVVIGGADAFDDAPASASGNGGSVNGGGSGVGDSSAPSAGGGAPAKVLIAPLAKK